MSIDDCSNRDCRWAHSNPTDLFNCCGFLIHFSFMHRPAQIASSSKDLTRKTELWIDNGMEFTFGKHFVQSTTFQWKCFPSNVYDFSGILDSYSISWRLRFPAIFPRSSAFVAFSVETLRRMINDLTRSTRRGEKVFINCVAPMIRSEIAHQRFHKPLNKRHKKTKAPSNSLSLEG